MHRATSLFKITPGLREYHNYRRDTAYDGRYLRRLPDRTLVPADEYEAKLREYEKAVRKE